MSTVFENLVSQLRHDINRARPKDELQYCADWLATRLSEQRAQVRDVFERSSTVRPPFSLPPNAQSPLKPPQGPRPSVLGSMPRTNPPRHSNPSEMGPFDASPGSPHSTDRVATSPLARNSQPRRSSGQSPFGTLNLPGNAAVPSSSLATVAHRSFPAINEEDDTPDHSSHHSLTIPSAHMHRSVSPSSSSGAGAFLGPPPSALGRRVSVSAESISPSSGPERPPPFFAKSPEQLMRLEEAISDAFLFRKLDKKKRNAVLGAMKEMHFETNECVIKQGDDGDYFYVVDSGTLDCFKQSAEFAAPEDATSSSEWHPVFGKKVFAYEKGGAFGELALMYHASRAATVITTSPCTLWALDRVTFQTILLDISARTRRSYESFLASVPLLESLNDAERAKLADVLQPREFEVGQAVVHEGEVGKEFYIVEEGEAQALKKVRNSRGEVIGEEVVKLYKRGDYFGELALLHRSPRAATVCAYSSQDARLKSGTKLKVAALDADAFTRLLGPLRDLMERSAAIIYSSGPVAT